MKQLYLFLIIMIAFAFQSCKPIAKLLYGISEPKFVNEQQLHETVKELFGSDLPVLVVKYGMWAEGKLYSIPDMYVFDKSGKYIPYHDSLRPDCNGPAERFVKNLNTDSEYYISEEFDLNSFVNQLSSANCDTFDWKYEVADFYLFFTFTTWSGKKLYKEKTSVWFQDLLKKNDIKYKVFAVSVDWMDCWSTEQKQKILQIK